MFILEVETSISMKFMLDFIIIGAHRCGTTWLHENLSQHSEVFMPRQKELHFFDREDNFCQGLAYYSRYFTSVTNNLLIGEATPNYFATENVPKRIHRYFPNTKLILMLRHPIDRLYSAYKLNCGNNNVIETFESFIKRKQIMVEEGLYYKHLLEYLEYYTMDDIHISFYAELRKNSANVYRNILEYLDINNTMFLPRTVSAQVNSWGIKKYNCKSRMLYYTMLALKKSRMFFLSSIIERINRRNGKEPIKQNTRNLLLDYYRESNEHLSSILQIDLSAWNA